MTQDWAKSINASLTADGHAVQPVRAVVKQSRLLYVLRTQRIPAFHLPTLLRRMSFDFLEHARNAAEESAERDVVEIRRWLAIATILVRRTMENAAAGEPGALAAYAEIHPLLPKTKIHPSSNASH